jgi:hypothetical protein
MSKVADLFKGVFGEVHVELITTAPRRRGGVIRVGWKRQ